ncbi:MAG: thioether cross-link-forming SCIFF peptide maturase [Clostridiales bacterium]|jgi:uncharacterized protein|nr:thioether cross-link-forming SCIFF peptide maturase [Clostridiales bacterium]
MIHKFHINGLYIVLDVNSGSIHQVDKIVYDILDYYKDLNLKELKNKLSGEYPAEEIEEACEELDYLVKNNLLYSQDNYEQKGKEKKLNHDTVVKALCLHVAHDCNLRCGYCFAEEGEYHGKRSLMSFEVGKAAIDFLIKNSGNRRNLEVDFFGGEPLMNFDVVKKIVEYGRLKEKKFNKLFRFTMTTNGVLLDDEKLLYINEHMHNLVLSMDGRKEVNDNMRKTVNGGGSYDLITSKFIKAANSRNQTGYYLRGTFTKNNLDFSKDIEHMASLGFKQISVEPVVAAPEEPYAIAMEDVPVICDEYEKLAVDMMNKGADYNFFHFMVDLSGGPCVYKRMAGCGAGTEYLAVTPEGDLYPCHQFVGIHSFKIGDVFNGIENTEVGERFDSLNVYSKEDCKNCWAKFYCSGGCVANAYNMNGDITKPYEIACLLQKKRTECAIALKAFNATAVKED